ncbi:MAG: DUF3137 domain-containing protein [Chitinophagales bacterium]|nr:DUF3137 domain-containing protein [Bacteroidota bacterium]MBK8682303.1 DUF3137 domain-containing protein [Bacteroidota bacterium]
MPVTSSPQLQYIFKNKLIPALYKTETLRKRIIFNYIIFGIVFLAGFALEAITWMSIGIAIVVIFVLAYTSRFGVSVSDFTNSYQSTVAQTISRDIIPNATYNYDGYHKLRLLNDAYLISGFPAQYGGMHLLTFIEYDIQCAISEIQSHTEQKNKQGFNAQLKVFNGLVGLADLHINLNDPIIIITNKLLNSAIKENSEFINVFENKDGLFIYNADQFILEKIISPEVLLIIKNYTELHRKDIFISIYKSGICIAVHASNYLQPSIIRTTYNLKPPEQYYYDLDFIYNTLHLCCSNFSKEIREI